MAVQFSLTSKTRFDTFEHIASIGDISQFEIDCSAWADDNATITTAIWTVEYGQASISGQAITSNVVSAKVSFAQSGRVLISILISTAGGLAKKIWLAVMVKDKPQPSDDYGFVA